MKRNNHRHSTYKNRNKKKEKNLMHLLSTNDATHITNAIDSVGELKLNKVFTGGGDTNVVDDDSSPTKIDEILNMITGSVNDGIQLRTGFIEKLNSYGTKYTNIIKGLLARNFIKIIGLEGKTVEEVSQELANDSAKLDKIVNFLDTPEGQEMLKDFNSISDKASNIASDTVNKIVDKMHDPMEEMAENVADAGTKALSATPLVGNAMSAVTALNSGTKALGSATELISTTVDTTAEAIEKISEPINDAIDKTKEISAVADRMTNWETNTAPNAGDFVTNTETKSTPIAGESVTNWETNWAPIAGESVTNTETNSTPSVGEQSGGSVTQYGGKYIRNRVSLTKNAFNKIRKKVTKKNRN